MKKIILFLLLAVVIATGSAFATHPNGKWGVGIFGSYGIGWGYGGGGISLKVPTLPIYWGFNFGLIQIEITVGLC